MKRNFDAMLAIFWAAMRRARAMGKLGPKDAGLQAVYEAGYADGKRDAERAERNRAA